ncbi:ankyrin repeat domain-containing protein [Cystobacter ferrugineus]|nr:ankyrin repeat domain-containing protein [Cystobacter ferrugineus]
MLNARRDSVLPTSRREVADTASPGGAGTASSPLHQAVLDKDIDQVRALISAGVRPTALDESRRSPLDLLDSMSLDPSTKQQLRHELLVSKNPTAPTHYTKWEAGHGSPWGLEILGSGELKGGVNDAKGGAESLEGMVFFSDRTPERSTDSTTRDNLRSKARLYAEGKGTKPSSAVNRALQYKMTQAMQAATDKGTQLNLTQKPIQISVDSMDEVRAAIKTQMQSILTDNSFVLPGLTKMSPEQISSKLKFPSEITVSSRDGAERKIIGDELARLYAELGGELKSDLENGKAPFLGLINNGAIVPMVFGFEKISGLKSHTISGAPNEAPKQFSYQNKNHPLGGSEAGGKLKEIELRDLKDLATLQLGCLAKGIEIPPDVVIRINPAAGIKSRTGVKAQYLTRDQVEGFNSRLLQEIASATQLPPGEVSAALAKAPISRLQTINGDLRERPLDTFVPERRSGDEFIP